MSKSTPANLKWWRFTTPSGASWEVRHDANGEATSCRRRSPYAGAGAAGQLLHPTDAATPSSPCAALGRRRHSEGRPRPRRRDRGAERATWIFVVIGLVSAALAAAALVVALNAWLLDRDADRDIQPDKILHGVNRVPRVPLSEAQPLGRFNGRVGLHDINSDLNTLEGDNVLADIPSLARHVDQSISGPHAAAVCAGFESP